MRFLFGGYLLLTFSRTRISRSRRISRCCSAWESTQSRIICCSVRMWWTRPWIASARLAMAVVAARLDPPSAITSFSPDSNFSFDVPLAGSPSPCHTSLIPM